MQVSPSAALFQALSSLMQPQGPQQVQGQSQGPGGNAPRPVAPGAGPAASAPGGTATAPGAGGPQQAATTGPTERTDTARGIAIPEAPEPGTPIRRGMLVDLSA
ncbi:MAG: hypothetical protein RID91_13770 [Azospirillaceae bacterium]